MFLIYELKLPCLFGLMQIHYPLNIMHTFSFILCILSNWNEAICNNDSPKQKLPEGSTSAITYVYLIKAELYSVVST